MPPSPDARAQFQEPAALSAASILTPDMLAGAHHEVADEVDNDGFFNRYTVNSPFGTFEAPSSSALSLLINEINAIAEMKKVKTDDTATESLKQSDANMVSGIKDLFTDMLLFIGHGTQIRGFDSLGVGAGRSTETRIRQTLFEPCYRRQVTKELVIPPDGQIIFGGDPATRESKVRTVAGIRLGIVF